MNSSNNGMTPFSGKNSDGGDTCTDSMANDRCNDQIFSLSPFKAVQHDDDVTTAYSSWNDEDDNHEFSPCRSTQDDELDMGIDNDVFGSGEEDRNFSSSDRKQETPLQLTVLYERAAMLLRRERSLEYRVTNNYCAMGQTIASFPTLSVQDAPESTMSVAGVARREEEASAGPSSNTIIDASCRSKMMEWAIRVVEFSYPPPPQTNAPSPHSPRHARETLYIVSTAFSYVDRIMTQSKVLTCYPVLMVPTRKEYKLLCMISLHLAAKMSGLFGSGDLLEYPVLKNVKANRGRDKRRTVDMVSNCASRSRCSSSVSTTSAASIGTATTTTGSSSNSFAEPSSDSDPSSEEKKNQRHSSTLNHHPSSTIPAQHRHHHARHPPNPNKETIRPRPSLNLLSLSGLYSLCQGEFTINEMCRMELSILKSLDWKLNSGIVFDWLDLIIEWGTLNVKTSEDVMNSIDEELAMRYDWEEIRDIALFQVETAIKSYEFMTVIPSVLALAALANSADTYADSSYLVSRLIPAFDFSFCVEDLMSVMTAIKFHLKSGAENV
ncbi:hypothetical protein HJC23_007256 [Cyclotella cryptica]|uniref:Cyclin N-terminal domain-containing protein n=1 Tax=Cyclotella cryptica TaxID=29204 RepID=A0ABD3Q1K1_9STRA